MSAITSMSIQFSRFEVGMLSNQFVLSRGRVTGRLVLAERSPALRCAALRSASRLACITPSYVTLSHTAQAFAGRTPPLRPLLTSALHARQHCIASSHSFSLFHSPHHFVV